MTEKNFRKKWSVWRVLSCCSLVCGVIMLCKGIDKMTNYYNSEYSHHLRNAYVGGDAYNYIINGNYATGFFVLTTMFVLAAIGLMILHYLYGNRPKSAFSAESSGVPADASVEAQAEALPQTGDEGVSEDGELNVPQT